MAGLLWFLQRPLGGLLLGSGLERLIGVAALVGAGILVYFALAWTIGGMNKNDFLELARRKPPAAATEGE
jgi:hypothetical protein